MQVRLERTDRLVVGVRDEVALHRLFAGDLADAGHRGAPEFAKGADYTGFLEQSALRERDRVGTGDDEMVEHLDFHHGERVREVARQQLVRAARLGKAGRMVVREDHRCGVEA